MPTPDFSCDLCLEAEAMESLQNFQGLNLISQIQTTLTHLTFSSRDGDSSKKKKNLGIPLMHIAHTEDSFPFTLGAPQLPWTATPLLLQFPGKEVVRL